VSRRAYVKSFPTHGQGLGRVEVGVKRGLDLLGLHVGMRFDEPADAEAHGASGQDAGAR